MSRGYDTQKSLFWPISDHPKSCVTDLPLYLPSDGQTPSFGVTKEMTKNELTSSLKFDSKFMS